MSESAEVTLDGVYQDAAGHWHAIYVYRSANKDYKGEAVFDAALSRVILGETAEHWPASMVRDVKRALREAFAQHVNEAEGE